MISFIETNNIFSKTQFGFRSGLSTEAAKIYFIDKIHTGQNKRHHTVEMFTDLSKVVDVTDHTILAKKLEHYGFKEKIVDLLKDFVSNRKYFVSTNGLNSTTKGSTLCPFFIIYK
ncbi:unnamed protein product [Meganyctiphanes norvegica]|uniref:Reverse transcriptase domain-containing protein n=2 Tax=Meganyctiphanes norvegica TaxID=48144 RepID=A0AAV2Q4B7_MEGNR